MYFVKDMKTRSATQKQPAETAASADVHVISEAYQAAVSHDLHCAIKNRNRWRILAMLTEATSHLFVALGCVLVYATSAINNNPELKDQLVYGVGFANALSIALLRFSVFAQREYTERTSVANKLLAQFDLPPLANTVDAPASIDK